MNTKQLPLTLYVDESCPLCAREARFLRRHANPEQLRLVDISSVSFSPEGTGLSLNQLQNSLHARTPDGEWLTGIDATLSSWRAAGLGVWVAPLALKPLRPLWLVLYRLFVWLKPHLAWLPHPQAKARCNSHCMGGEDSMPLTKKGTP